MGFTQPLTKMSTRSRKIMFLGSKVRPVRRADSLAAICEQVLDNVGTLNISKPYRLPSPVTGIALVSLPKERKFLLMEDEAMNMYGRMKV
jgi:hypothetical protein